MVMSLMVLRWASPKTELIIKTTTYESHTADTLGASYHDQTGTASVQLAYSALTHDSVVDEIYLQVYGIAQGSVIWQLF